MLSAFQAQPIYELKQRDKAKVESLLAYGDRLLVGLNTGALRIFRVNEASSSSHVQDDQANRPEAGEAVPPSPTKSTSKAVDLLREEEKFSKKAVLQLAIVKEASLLISLSDGYVSLHDLQSYQLVERLERTKGAACFAVTSNVVKDLETHVPGLVSRLAVGTKRKVLCWTWQDMELLPDVLEFSLEASIKCLNWVDGTHLVAGMDPGFSLIDILTQQIMPVSKPAGKAAADASSAELAGSRFGAVSSSGMGYMGMGSWVPKPMATAMSGDQVLLAKDVNTLFVSVEGKALEKRQVPWALAPEAIGYSYPYLLALQPPDKGTLQIRNPDTLTLLQTISVPGALVLHVPQPYISLAHAGKGFLLSSERIIWRMNALPYHTQLAEMVGKQRFDEAISLLKLLEDTLIDDKSGRIRETMTQKAIALFHQQKYRPALDLFTDAETNPHRVISLYPRSIAGELSSTIENASDHDVAIESLNPTADDSPKKAPSTPSKGVLGKFTVSARNPEADSASTRSHARGDDDDLSVRAKPTKGQEKSLEGDNLKFAVRCLCSFLAEARKNVQKYMLPDGDLKQNPPSFDSETHKPAFSNLLPERTADTGDSEIDWRSELLKTAVLVDTTLFRAYMLATPSLVGSLFRIDNFCDPDVVQAALYAGERYNDLIDFLHGKKLHRQALEMLTKFGKCQAEGEVTEGMRGPERTAAYLKQLPPELVDLILEYARWPIEQDAKVGMDVFLADTDNAERLPRQKVLSFLAEVSGELEKQYLEHVINELGDVDAEFHQRLIDLYIAELKQPVKHHDQQAHIAAKLESFLLKSSVYSKRKTFEQLPADVPAFFESRAIVLSAMGNHKQALAIYVFQLRNYDKAEEYCNKVFLEGKLAQEACLLNGRVQHEKYFRPTEPKDNDEKSNIFALLLALYLRPPTGEEKHWPQALELLSKHGARLPASSTLDLMPDDLAVKELQDYFRGRIRNATSIMREDMIVRGLEGVRRAEAERVLLLGPDNSGGAPKALGRNRRVRVGEEDHCKVCHKRFGASAVRVYPDNEVIHYGCIGRSGNQRIGRRAANWVGI